MRRTHKHESNEAGKRGGLARSSEEGSVMELKRRGRTGTEPIQQQPRKTVSEQRKQHAISRVEVERAWRKVRAKGGKGGVDGESIKSYENCLVRWLRRKYVLSWAAAIARLNRLARSGPRTFVHWMFRFPGRAV